MNDLIMATYTSITIFCGVFARINLLIGIYFSSLTSSCSLFFSIIFKYTNRKNLHYYIQFTNDFIMLFDANKLEKPLIKLILIDTEHLLLSLGLEREEKTTQKEE